MAKLDFFTIHVETETDWVNTNVELNFICNDHTTIIECDGLAEDADINRLLTCLKRLFERETECTYEVKQYLDGFKHLVSIYGNREDPNTAFECDSIKVTERE